MKSLLTSRSNGKNGTTGVFGRGHGKLGRSAALIGAAVAGVLLAAQLAPAGDIFVVAMENHNFTQPIPTSSPQQILANPAAPFINSLITPGNANAAQVSYATAYYNAGMHVHPSEPNYVWAEAGTDFGVHTDADPRAASGNTFYDQSVHLTAQLNAAGISWKNYQEDVQLSVSPTNSASGTNGPMNPYYGTTQFNYAVKHNPMAFFADTAVQNVYPLAQFFLDLNNNAVGQYNWITPNQFNDAHSALSGGFTYQGVHYAGDQASIAQGDNFLATIIPQIMASAAYQDNGVIIIWWDETESADDTNHTIPEIVISPLAKGNAYASSVPLNHSSDIKTMSELFGLPAVNNPIPVTETNADGGYNNVAVVNDLSDLFVPGAIPAPPSVSVARGGFVLNPHTHHVSQLVRLTNSGTSPVPAPLFLVLDNLSANATLFNADGTSAVLAPLGSPYVSVPVGGDDILQPHEAKTVALEFLDPSGAGIDYDTRVLAVTPAP
ncbi:MAG TPA: alkaline phosphatase family protein [Candidatus Acidoferrum sp.]|nr:alkaline phosphatase family protein [Candidatus Acidoferrum sp.]